MAQNIISGSKTKAIPYINVGNQMIRNMATARTSADLQPMRKNWKTIEKALRGPQLAMSHFDSLYSNVYGRNWMSIRLGLLTTKKQVAIINSFIDTSELRERLVEDDKALDLARYYKKHLQSYTRLQLRQQIIDNKKARKREMMAKESNTTVESINIDSIEVSDVSDSEIRGTQTTDASEGFSSAEDLQAMFSDRRLDEDERYFVNKASPMISLNDFMPATELLTKEEFDTGIEYYDTFKTDLKLDIKYLSEPTLEFSEELKIYSYPRNDWSCFESPTIKTKDNLLSHYILDGGSILPVLALDIQLDDVCADYCAAPGGKSLAILMTFRPKYLLCNDMSSSRLGKMYSIFRQYVPEVKYVKSTLRLSNTNATDLVQPDAFDKILVDVPCSSDRQSVTLMDNNLFKRDRSAERLRLPKTQCDILVSALKSVRPGGSVVYSTCTMSPIENDSVVQNALQQLQLEGHPSKYAVVSLKEAFRPLRGLYRFHTRFKFGQQLLPSVSSNFGPMYISKIKRLS